MPREVLADYESMVREAGFEPGAVLPSTLAALAGLAEGEHPTLVVNAGREGVTTAIVKAGVLLLHRTVDLGADARRRSEGGCGGFWARRRLRSMWPRGAHETVVVCAPEIIVDGGLAATASEVAQAVSVAAAYFEDTLQSTPAVVLAAGTLGAEALTRCWLSRSGDWAGDGARDSRPGDAGRGRDGGGTAGRRAAGLAGGRAGGAGKLMRISINLATRPFVELRPLFARLRLAMAGLAVMAIGAGDVGCTF